MFLMLSVFVIDKYTFYKKSGSHISTVSKLTERYTLWLVIHCPGCNTQCIDRKPYPNPKLSVIYQNVRGIILITEFTEKYIEY